MQSKNKIGAWAHMRPPPPPPLLAFSLRVLEACEDMTTSENMAFFCTNISKNHELHVMHMHHSSRANGTAECV